MTKLALAAALALVLLPAAPVLLAERLGVTNAGEASASSPASQAGDLPTSSVAASACEVTSSARKLGRLPQGTVFAPLDLGPAILLGSSHSVVATSHHRADAAMADVIRAFTAPPEKARAILAARGADYLALCSDLAEPEIYRAANAKGLAAELLRGHTPDWLEPVNIGAPPQFRVWRVRAGLD